MIEVDGDHAKTAVLEEDAADAGGDHDNDDVDDDGSYVLSRRSSYTESLPAGLGNRVGLLTLIHCLKLSFHVQ